MPDRSSSDGFADDVAGSLAESLAGLAGIVVPGMGPVVKRLNAKVREEVQRNRSTALKAAEDASGLSREDIAERIAAEPRLVPLVIRLLHAAGMNGHERALRAMGTALGDAVCDRNSIDECELILTSLADLTEHHSRVLLVLSQDPPRLSGTKRYWWLELLQEQTDLPPRATTLCAAALVARGLVETSGLLDGVNAFQVTDLGWTVLALLDSYHDAGRSRTSAK
jgi:hypothetical protein